MTRRTFLGSLGSATLVAGCELEDVARLVDDVRADARIGVLANTEIGWKNSTGALQKALRYFRQEGVDAVVVTGKVTLNGWRDQVEVFEAVWREVFGVRSDVRLILDDGRYEVAGFTFGVSARRPVVASDVLTFHGQGKQALTNDFWFYDDEVRSVYAGSMSGLVVLAGYEYCGRVSDGKMTLSAAQGLLVTLYSSRIAIRRLDFTQSGPVEGGRLRRGEIYAEDVAEEFVLDRTTLRSIAPVVTPEFWEDARLRIFCGYEGVKRILTVKWPHVLKRFRGARAARYEVAIRVSTDRGASSHAAIARRYVLTRGFHLAESRDLEPVSCVLDDQVLAGFFRANPQLILSVTPVGVRGARGRSLDLPLERQNMI